MQSTEVSHVRILSLIHYRRSNHQSKLVECDPLNLIKFQSPPITFGMLVLCILDGICAQKSSLTSSRVIMCASLKKPPSCAHGQNSMNQQKSHVRAEERTITQQKLHTIIGGRRGRARWVHLVLYNQHNLCMC
jgi:hypothetical protein